MQNQPDREDEYAAGLTEEHLISGWKPYANRCQSHGREEIDQTSGLPVAICLDRRRKHEPELDAILVS